MSARGLHDSELQPLSGSTVSWARSMRRRHQSPSVVRLTPAQYRRFHALAKREAGAALAVSSYQKLGAWGQFSCMADSVVKNAAAPRDVQLGDEVACITLASRINVDKLHAATRPEMDWSAIPKALVYEFIFWHEVGHRLDNFDAFDFMTSKYRSYPDFHRWHRHLNRANEVLADRFAWNRLFPGRPMAVAKQHSPEYLRELDAHIEQFSRDVPRAKYKVRPLPEGRAEYIPSRMLGTANLARFAGVPVQPRQTGPGSRDIAQWQEAYAAARIGPQRPFLEITEGSAAECVTRQDFRSEEASMRLRVGRDCPSDLAIRTASLYGFRREEIEFFLAGARPLRGGGQ